MSRTTAVLPVFLFLCVPVFAEGGTVVLQNPESSPFYYLLDPQELSSFDPASPSFPAKLMDYFAAETDTFAFTRLDPNTSCTIEALAAGTHLLVGFFAETGKTEFPVRVMTLQVDGTIKERFYWIYSEPALISVGAKKGRLAGFPGTADQAGKTAGAQEESGSAALADAGKSLKEEASVTAGGGAQSLAAFSQSFSPVIFTREEKGGIEVLPIGSSRFWDKAGTRIREVRGSLSRNLITLSLQAGSPFSESTSYFLYLFKDREKGKDNPLTVELKPVAKGTSGFAVIWKKGTDAPAIIGETSAKGTLLEIRIPLDELEPQVLAELGSNPSVDLTSCYYSKDEGLFEEFYFTTFSLSDIPAN